MRTIDMLDGLIDMTIAPLKIADLPTEVQALTALLMERERYFMAVLEAHHAAIEVSNARYESLRAQVAQLQRMQFGKKSEKLEGLIAQGDLFAVPVTVPVPKIETEQISYERRASKGRPKLPDTLPVTIVDHDLSETQRQSIQPASLEKIGEDRREYIDYEPARLTKIVHVLPTYAALTSEGEKTIITAELPIECAPPLARTNATANTLAQILVAKYQDHQPLNRQERIFARSGQRIARQTLCDWIQGATHLLKPLYLELKAHVLICPKIHTDETTLPLIDPDSHKTAKAKAWAYVGVMPDGPTAVVFDFTEDRKGIHPRTFLEGYSGYLQADAYAGYDQVYEQMSIVNGKPAPRIIEVACWAHARRKFFDIFKSEPLPKKGEPPRPPSVARIALDWIAALYARERWAKDEKLSPQERLLLRQRQSRRLLKHFRAWLERHGVGLLPQSPTAKAIAYALSNWNALVVYCEAPFLDIDNNAAERALRPLVLGRRNWLFVGSQNGGEAAAIIYSLIETAKANGICPFQYLADTLARINGTKLTELKTLLPFKHLRDNEEATKGTALADSSKPPKRCTRRTRRTINL